MLKLVNLTKIYKSSENVGIGIQNVNLELKRGEFVAIVGPSGAGKTTLLNVISGMDSYEEGEFYIDGKSTSDFSIDDFENYRRANVAFIFQNYQLIDSYTVLENVMIELIFKGYNKKDAKIKAKEILARVGMSHRLRNRAAKLSGGEKQRVVIARAIASNAEILVCDEPTGNLDSKNSIEIMKLIKEAAKDKLVLLVTHDESLIAGNATRIISVRDGRIESDRILEENTASYSPLKEIKPNKVSTQMFVAFKNVLRTPKKSLFVFAVFVILAIVLFNSIAYIPTQIIAADVSTYEYMTYKNRDANRIIVYDQNEYYTDEHYVVSNDYFLDLEYYVAPINANLSNTIGDRKSFIKATLDNLDIVAGRVPSNSDEVLLILGDSKGLNEDIIDSKIKIGLERNKGYTPSFYNIVGVAAYNKEFIKVQESNSNSTSSDKNSAEELYNTVDFYLTLDGLNNLYGEIKHVYPKQMVQSFIDDMYFITDDDIHSVGILEYTNNIQISYRYKDTVNKLLIGDTLIDLSNYDVEYVLTYDSKMSIKIGIQILLEMAERSNYRHSVYVEDSLFDEYTNSLKEEDVIFYAIRDLKKVVNTYYLSTILENLFYFVFIFVEIIISVFIVSIITSFVLGTKKKELGVLRVIGLSEKDVLSVLNFELIMLMIIAIGFTLGFSIISPKFNFNFDFTYIFNDIPKLIFTTVVLICMAYYISFRWNKKMFKKSAREVLKVGDAV